MSTDPGRLALASFHRAAKHVPAYRILLEEARVDPADINDQRDFSRVPILEKRDTFQRFEISQLCIDGQLGQPASVLTSSGHSGIFAFGLTEKDRLAAAAKWTDDLLDPLFKIKSIRTLLINCLPMGVKVSTEACTLAETSVRPDMAVGLVQAFGRHFGQIIFVGDAAFIKLVLERGRQGGVDWRSLTVHVIVGEEPLAENARKYLESVLGIDRPGPGKGMVISSMGIAEVGLNLFFEAPPAGALILLRRTLHENPILRRAVLGSVECVPSLLTYDPGRIFVEFDPAGRLMLTTLDPRLRIPLIRYAPGDRGHFIHLPAAARSDLEAAGISWELLESIPLVAIQGRGDHASAGDTPAYPEAVKEGIYHDHALAALTTANFRLVSGPERVRVRIQLSPGIKPEAEISRGFRAAIEIYVQAPLEVAVEAYDDFGDGMTLDYERKFPYVEIRGRT